MTLRPKTGVLLLNVGTPNSPRVPDVRRYLRQFLGDGRVIDLPWLGRKLLVNGVIAPFRGPKSAKAYRALWTDNGSPLITHSRALCEGLQGRLGEGYHVTFAMTYQDPSIRAGLDAVRRAGAAEIVLVPLFPQYASSSTGAALQAVMNSIAEWNDIPPVSVVPPFHAEEGYLRSFEQNIRACEPSRYDHVLFSFHGLPERHIQRSHTACAHYLQRQLDAAPIDGCACGRGPYDAHPTCYKMQCHATARALAQRAGLQPGAWSVGFQSRLDKAWVKPFSDEIIKAAPAKGVKRMLVASPAFVADCLETVIEIGVEYAEMFKQHGGQELTLVPSLNASPVWVDALSDMIARRAHGIR